MIAKKDLEAISLKANIIKLAKKRGLKLKKLRKGQYEALCCFHNEKTASLILTNKTDYDLFHCFGCSKAGTAIIFVMMFDHVPFEEAVIRIAEEIGYELKLDRNEFELLRERVNTEEIIETENKVEVAKYNLYLSIALRKVLIDSKTASCCDEVDKWVEAQFKRIDEFFIEDEMEEDKVESFYKIMLLKIEKVRKKFSK